MVPRLVYAFVCSLLALSLIGCATSRPRSSTALPSGGSSYTGENLGQQVARHEQQIQTLLSQVGQVEQVLPGQAEMWSQVQTMRQDLNGLMGQVDDLKNQTSASGSGEMARLNERLTRLEEVVRKIASQLAINVDSLDAPSAVPQGAPGSVAPHQTPPGAVPTRQEPPSAAEPQSALPSAGSKDTASTLYEAGIKAFDKRNYKEALVSFKDFTAYYPKDKLASNGYFWQGECYFQLKDFGRAALAYQDVIAKYPGSGKMQSAMLKQGIALHHLGKKEASKERLQELVKKYPNSAEATRAKQFLSANK